MEKIEIEQCLKSMSILVDTREQPSDRALKRYESFNCPYSRQTLNYGDYTYNFEMPDGSLLFPPGRTIYPDVIVERKMDLVELSGCFTQSRKRFSEEFQRAIEHNCSIYLLVENATWENLLNGKYKTKFDSKAYFASVTAFMARYNIKPIFCKSESSGKIIKEVLYRELKERLERGDYG